MKGLVAAAAFDPRAARYDSSFTDAPLGRVLRRRVWRTIDGTFAPGDRVLDIGCGTGADAIHMARRGAEVIGVDASPAMVEVARRQVDRAGVADSVAIVTGPLEGLDGLDLGPRAQGVLANFGVLNCVVDLAGVGAALGRRLTPGARIVAVVMSPGCWWELVPLPVPGHRRRLLRRLRPGGAEDAGGSALVVRYPGPGALLRGLGPDYRLRRVRGLGLALPPTYLASAVAGRRRLMALLASLDGIAGAWPGMPLLADHYIAEVQWRPW